MKFDDQRRPPAWVERSDLTWGSDLTPSEYMAEELDERPSLRLLLGGRSSSSRCHVNSPGADRPVAPPHHARPAAKNTPPAHTAAGPDLQQGFHYEIQSNGCWIWLRGRNSAGYGKFYDAASGKHYLAHRYMYESLRGPIPDGLQLDHLCRVRTCCNPDHLEAVTQRENIRRGNASSGINARKTHCHRGHPFDEENTRFKANGSRNCRACQRISDAIRRGTIGASDPDFPDAA